MIMTLFLVVYVIEAACLTVQVFNETMKRLVRLLKAWWFNSSSDG